jgi:hypothetical protein
MSRNLLTLLALGVLAALAGLWILDPFAPRRGAAAEPGAVASNPEASPIEDTRAPEAPLERGVEQPAWIRSEAVSPTDEPDAEFAAVALETIRVVTVAHGSDTPLPGTVIGLATSTRMGDFQGAHPDSEGADIEELVDLAGERFVTDERGEADLPFYGEGMRITARHEDRFTYAWLDGSETQPLRIELFVDRELEIQVVDASGQPAPGVPVAIVLETLRGANELWKGVTEGEAGLAHLRHADVRLSEAYGLGRLAAELDIPTKSPVDVTFEPDPWPSDPLRIELPETGSVTVRLFDAAAGPYEKRARVNLYVEREDGEGAPARRVNFERRTETGVAIFERVGLDTQMRVLARSEDELKPRSDELQGPSRAGEQVELSITFDERYPRVVGRLLEPGGRPLASHPVETRVLTTSVKRRSGNSHDRVVTDGEGRFQVVISQALREGGTRTLELRARAAGGTSADLSAQLDLSGALPDEDFDVGDVQLEPAPLICAGHVVDDSGAPVAGARVRLDYARMIAGANGRKDWQRASTATTGPDGAFELRGDVLPAELRVFATKSGWSHSGPSVVAAGSCDLILRLERNGSLAGYLELNRGVPSRMFEVRAAWDRVDANGERRRGNRAARSSPDGSFELEAIPPGSVEVSVLFTGSGVRLRRLEGVLVTGGEETRDPRLAPLDLTSEVFAYGIEVVDTALQPVGGGSVSVVAKGRDQGRPMAFAIRAGLARLITLESLVDVVVTAPGFRSVLIRGVHTDRQVMLEAAIPVGLRLADGVALPQPPLYLRAKLIPAGLQKKKRRATVTQIFQDGEWAGTSNPYELDESNTFGPSRVLSILVSDPGPHRVYFEVLKRRSQRPQRPQRPSGGSRSQTLGGGKPRQIQVDASDAGRTFEVAPPREAYERALLRLSE